MKKTTNQGFSPAPFFDSRAHTFISRSFSTNENPAWPQIENKPCPLVSHRQRAALRPITALERAGDHGKRDLFARVS